MVQKEQRDETEASAAQKLNILIVDDEANIRKTLSIALEIAGHSVTAVGNGKEGLAQASRHSTDLVFLDLRLGVEKGTDYIPEFIAASPWIKIVVITAYASVETAVEAMKLGAIDYLPKPFTPSQVQAIAARIGEIKQAEGSVSALGDPEEGAMPGMDLGSQSPVMQRALTMARQVASSQTNVLLRGESGTGKSVLARFIHSKSPRSPKPFGVVSCPSLSSELLESELFGHVRGAFTGALRDYPGRIAACDAGTLFLDEIGDLPLQVQPKLLRFLQDREYERVGDSTTLKADIRIVAATNLDLESLVQSGKFREDLLYRLNVFQIDLPNLRERPEDISLLANRFLAAYSRRNARQFAGFSEEALQALKKHPWPGNIRELQNKIERAVIVSQGTEIGILELALKPVSEEARISIGDPVALDKVEEAHIRSVLASAKSLEDAARILGIDTATLWRRRKKYRL
jgi:NtrC-family two-component system response regulator AlgB